MDDHILCHFRTSFDPRCAAIARDCQISPSFTMFERRGTTDSPWAAGRRCKSRRRQEVGEVRTRGRCAKDGRTVIASTHGEPEVRTFLQRICERKLAALDERLILGEPWQEVACDE